MKHSFATVLLLIVAFCLAASTTMGQSEAQRLNARLADHYQKGELDSAIAVAEEIVSLERRSNPVSSTNLTSALENLAQVKLDRVKRSTSELRSVELTSESVAAILKRLRKDALDTEGHLREALLMSRTALQNTAQSVNLRSNLAWILYNHIPAEANQTLGFDKDSRDNLEMRHRALYTKRFDEARTLYAEAAKISKDSDSHSSLSLATSFNLAEFESAMGNFEAAIPLYSKIVADAERSLGTSDHQLLAPYESYLKVLVAAGQQDAAFDVLSKVVAVSGKSTSYPKTLLNLTYRSDRPFAPVNSKRIEDDSRAMKEQAELAGRGTVARTAAAGGDIVGTSLAVSTNARDFYETADSKGVKMNKVAVKIELDERGKVVAAEGLSSDRGLKASAESAVKEWKFRPFSEAGKPAKLKGYVEVTVLSN